VFTLIGGADRKGRWRLAPRTTAVTFIGGPTLDLREATLEGAEAEITLFTLIGGADVIVPEGIAVETSGFTLIGGDDVKLAGEPPPPGAPVVRIRSYTLIGGTDVKDRTRSSRLRLPRPPQPPRL
jgi:cell wall-active antibiotic response 4TMS protein YvqF